MKKASFRIALISLLSLLASACADDISPESVDPTDPVDDTVLPGPGGAAASFSKSAAGYYQGVIDTSGSDWVYLDVDTQTQVTPGDPAASDAWDIAFMGTQIKLNGGVSGTPPTGFAAMIYGDRSAVGTAYGFEAVDGAPPSNSVTYRSDETTGLLPLPLPILGQSTAYAFTTYPEADTAADRTGAGDHGWYNQASVIEGSAITPRSNVGYVLRSLECHYFKLRITTYADSHLSFDVLQVPGGVCSSSSDDAAVAPLGHATFTTSSGVNSVAIDASDDAEWVHIDLAGMKQVAPTNPNGDATSWDIALRRSDIKLNGGSSGTGTVEITALLRDDWSARIAAPTGAEYHRDADGALAFVTYPPAEATPSAACASINGDFGWYYYSGFCDDGDGVHHISPRDVVYIVHDKAGASWKLRILDYYSDIGSGNFTLEYAPVSGR